MSDKYKSMSESSSKHKTFLSFCDYNINISKEFKLNPNNLVVIHKRSKSDLSKYIEKKLNKRGENLVLKKNRAIIKS